MYLLKESEERGIYVGGYGGIKIWEELAIAKKKCDQKKCDQNTVYDFYFQYESN